MIGMYNYIHSLLSEKIKAGNNHIMVAGFAMEYRDFLANVLSDADNDLGLVEIS